MKYLTILFILLFCSCNNYIDVSDIRVLSEEKTLLKIRGLVSGVVQGNDQLGGFYIQDARYFFKKSERVWEQIQQSKIYTKTTTLVRMACIAKGDRVLVIEAMKMETTINSEKSGTIQKIYVGSGDNVETKDLLIEIK